MVRFEGERGEVLLYSGATTHLVPETAGSGFPPNRVRPCGAPELGDDRPEQQIVVGDIAGCIRVEAEELEHKLGKLACTVWKVLRKYRNSEGITRITHVGLQKKLPGYRMLGLRKTTPFPISEDQIDRAFRRLVAAGLLKHQGWKPKTSPHVPRGISLGIVYHRTVYGMHVPRNPRTQKALKDPYYTVPERTAIWMETANTRGGARAGAGRPAEPDAVFSRAKAFFEERWGEKAKGVDWVVAKVLVGPRPTSEHVLGFVLVELSDAEKFDADNLQWVTKKLLRAQIQTAAGSIQTAATERDCEDSNRCGKKSIYSIYGSERIGSCVSSSKKEEENPSAGADGNLQLPAAPERVSHPPPKVTADSIQGYRTSTPLFARSPVPRPWIDTARIPPPPLIATDDTPEAMARKAAKAYSGAVEKVFKTRYWGFKSYDPTKWKGFKQLVAGAQLLAEHKIPPATWVLWCFKAWKQIQAKSGKARKLTDYPPVAWIFAPSRITERKGWYRREESEFVFNRVVNGPKVKRLIIAWYAYQKDLYTPGSDPNACVRKHFPGDTYEKLVADAKAEALEYRQLLQKHAEEGVFLWL